MGELIKVWFLVGLYSSHFALFGCVPMVVWNHTSDAHVYQTYSLEQTSPDVGFDFDGRTNKELNELDDWALIYNHSARMHPRTELLYCFSQFCPRLRWFCAL